MVPAGNNGVGYFRHIWPAYSLSEQFDDFIVEVNGKPDYNDLNYLKQFDIIHCHVTKGPHENIPRFFSTLRTMGVVTIADVDDFWELPLTHPLCDNKEIQRIAKNIPLIIQCVDYVTTSTSLFAAFITKINANVSVIPNAIDDTESVWQPTDTPNKFGRCRISWTGGSTHLNDLILLKGTFQSLYSSAQLSSKFQIVLSGFDLGGKITEITQRGTFTRPLRPEETVWNSYELIFTDDYRGLKNDQEYYQWLKTYKNEDYPDIEDKPYYRRWALPLSQYPIHYDYCDVCLAPLATTAYTKTKSVVANNFNLFKSELKIIEAGFKKKPIIAQDFGIYQALLKQHKTGILAKDPADWEKSINKMIREREFREEIGHNLYEWVKTHYTLDRITEKRAEFYRMVLSTPAEKN